MVVVDRLSKYTQFIPLSRPYTITTIAKLFIDNVFELLSIHISIVSDRHPTFVIGKNFKLHGSQLNCSSTYHPQMDGKSNVLLALNQKIGTNKYHKLNVGTTLIPIQPPK